MLLQSEALGRWGVAVALAGGAIRGSIPYMFVSLGECLTEKSGKINLGMEGVLLMGAMTAFAVSDLTGSPWLGVLAAAVVGLLLGAVHAWMTQQPARERCGGGHRHDPVRQRPGVLLRQALRRADGSAAAADRPGRMEPSARGAIGLAD